MLWDDLVDHFRDFTAACSKMRIAGWAGAETLRKFPENLPAEERQLLGEELGRLSKAMADAVKFIQDGTGEEPPKAPPEETQAEGKSSKVFVDAFLLLVWAMRRAPAEKKKPGFPDVDFGRLLREQELVLLIAQFEAFVANCVRAVCLEKPERLASGRKVTREDIIRAGSWDEVIRLLTETVTFEVGMEALGPRLRAVRDGWGIPLRLTEAEITELDCLEAVRHITLHNGGRVSPEFLRRTGRRELLVGDLVPVDEEAIARARRLVGMAATDMLLACGLKFFGLGERIPSATWCDSEMVSRHGIN